MEFISSLILITPIIILTVYVFYKIYALDAEGQNLKKEYDKILTERCKLQEEVKRLREEEIRLYKKQLKLYEEEQVKINRGDK